MDIIKAKDIKDLFYHADAICNDPYVHILVDYKGLLFDIKALHAIDDINHDYHSAYRDLVSLIDSLTETNYQK